MHFMKIATHAHTHTLISHHSKFSKIDTLFYEGERERMIAKYGHGYSFIFLLLEYMNNSNKLARARAEYDFLLIKYAL